MTSPSTLKQAATSNSSHQKTHKAPVRNARRIARELVVEGLYQLAMNNQAPVEVLAQLETHPEHARADRAMLHDAWLGINAAREALSDLILPKLDRPLGNVSPIERAVLMAATWELQARLDVPYRVVINEAMELAKRYGGTDGHKFINGVLDKLVPELRPDEYKAAPTIARKPRRDAAR